MDCRPMASSELRRRHTADKAALSGVDVELTVLQGGTIDSCVGDERLCKRCNKLYRPADGASAGAYCRYHPGRFVYPSMRVSMNSLRASGWTCCKTEVLRVALHVARASSRVRPHSCRGVHLC